MKLATGASFSHPVIGPGRDDVIDSQFSLKHSPVRGDGLDYYIDLEFEVTDDDLLQFIEAGHASYALHVEAKGFFYRKLFDHLHCNSQIKLEGNMVMGKVECLPLIVSDIPIIKYELSKFHKDYNGISFELLKGDILAIGHGFSFEAEKEYDPLEKLSSIMQVLPDSTLDNGAMQVELSEEKITVFVSKEDHSKYTKLQQQQETSAILLQSVAVPALTSAIAYLKSESDESIPYRWQKAIKRKADALGLAMEDSDPTDISCRILDGPFGRMLHCLDDLLEDDEFEIYA